MSQLARDYEALEEAFDDANELLRKVASGKGYKRAVKLWIDTLPEICAGCEDYYRPKELKNDLCESCRENADEEADEE